MRDARDEFSTQDRPGRGAGDARTELPLAEASAAANEETAAEIAAATRNPLWIIVAGMACFCAVVIAIMSQGSESAESATPTPTPVSAPGGPLPTPDATTLMSAAQDDDNWILPGKSYSANRYTALTQINKSNVGSLGMAWRTTLADDGEQSDPFRNLRTGRGC
jgi:hypothetical protein